METRVAVRGGKSLIVLGSHISRSVHQVGAAPPGLLLLGFTTNPSLVRWRGEQIDGPYLLFYATDCEFDGYGKAGKRGFVFSAKQEVIFDLADRLGIVFPGIIQPPVPPPITRDPRRLDRLAGLARSLLSPYSGTLDGGTEEEIIREEMPAITDANCHLDQCRTRTRMRAVKRALKCLEKGANKIVPISSIFA